jgi:hypothetical protein
MNIISKFKLTGILTKSPDGLSSNSLYKVLEAYAKNVIYPTVQAPNFIQIPIQPTPPPPYPSILNNALKYLRVTSAADGVEWVNIFPTFDHRDSGKSLVIASGGALAWERILPPYDAETAGKFLCFDGTNLAWSTVPYIPEIQENIDLGKVLRVSSGDMPVWSVVNEVPTPTGSGLYLRTISSNGSNIYTWGSLTLPSWADSTARPANPVTGTIGINLDTAVVECYIVNTWVSLN